MLHASSGSLGVGIAVALIAAFALQFVEGTFMILFPIELERLGVGDDVFPMIYGVGLSITYLAATVAAAVAGRLSGKRSPTWLMSVSAIVSLVMLIPMAFVTTWWQFIGLRVLLALVAGAGPTLAYAAVAAAAPPERRGKMVSLASSAGILGWAASPLTAGALIQLSPALLLALDGVLFAVVALMLLAAQRGLLDPIGELLPASLPAPVAARWPGGTPAEPGRPARAARSAAWPDKPPPGSTLGRAVHGSRGGRSIEPGDCGDRARRVRWRWRRRPFAGCRPTRAAPSARSAATPIASRRFCTSFGTAPSRRRSDGGSARWAEAGQFAAPSRSHRS